MVASARPLSFKVTEQQSVSALLVSPDDAIACFVLAHGAGTDMRHPALAAIAEGLAERRIATLRYNFPFTENGSRRPDAPVVAQATVRAAVTEARRSVPGRPLFAGGRSFGGRMTSQAEAAAPLGVLGLIFLSFPLHPAGKISVERAGHLAEVRIPMLFLQGDKDALADVQSLRSAVSGLGPRATLTLFEDADHSFHVPKRSGRSNDEVLHAMLDALAAWVQREIGAADAASP